MSEEIKDLVNFDETWYKGANDKERAIFREWLLGVLRMHSPVSVTFIKSDGTVREMNCTLKEDIIPKIENPKTSDTLCTVWDTEIAQWRSFKFENIKQINFSI